MPRRRINFPRRNPPTVVEAPVGGRTLNMDTGKLQTRHPSPRGAGHRGTHDTVSNVLEDRYADAVCAFLCTLNGDH
jgi:cytochrome c1